MTKTLNQLTELNETPADDDELLVRDTSAMEDKRVSTLNAFSGLRSDINDRTIAGEVEVDVAGGSDVTITEAQSKYGLIELTGTLTADIDVIVPDDARLYTILNSSTGSFTVTVKTSAGTGVVVPQGDTMVVRSDGTNVVSVMSQGGAGVPIGGYVFVQDNLTGAEVPDSDTHILLTAGESDSGEYNEGKLISESVTGSAPLVVATAVIDDASSPMDGQTINLINTEDRYIAPGTSAGTVANDQMQQITGSMDSTYKTGDNGTGAISFVKDGAPGPSQNEPNRRGEMFFDSADSPGARTGDRTNVKRIQVTAYMRYK